jgi:hypothetical protein
LAIVAHAALCNHLDLPFLACRRNAIIGVRKLVLGFLATIAPPAVSHPIDLPILACQRHTTYGSGRLLFGISANTHALLSCLVRVQFVWTVANSSIAVAWGSVIT